MSESRERNWLKNSPSPKAVKARIFSECVSKIKFKRNRTIAQHRNSSDHEEFVNDIINNRNIISQQQYEDVNFMKEIEDYIQLELEIEIERELELHGFPEEEYLDDYIYEESFEVDVDDVICPVCRLYSLESPMDSNQAVCKCGISFTLPVPSSSSGCDDFSRSHCSLNLLEEFKHNLAAIYDRHHMQCVNPFVCQSSENEYGNTLEACPGVPASTLTFQLFDGRLNAWCEICGFHETVT